MRYFILTIFCFLSVLTINAQSKTKEAEHYIKKYSPLAISSMREYGIPASITLAQGLLESGYGQSVLAKKSNNHFGIKCKKEWTGEKVYHDDDAAGECFRKYPCVEDSYTDHAVFLSSSIRYADLFKLPRGDYKGWAHGLKKAGYATNPKYPTLLIGLIELYELNSYDKGLPIIPKTKPSKKPSLSSTVKNRAEIAAYIMGGRSVYRDKKELFVYAQKSDSFEKIGRALKIRPKRLERFNRGVNTLDEGTKVLVSRKRNK